MLIAAGAYQEAISATDSIHIRGSGATVTSIQPDSISASLLGPTVRCSAKRGVKISGVTILPWNTELYPATALIDCKSSSIEIYNCSLLGTRGGATELVQIWRKSEVYIHDDNFQATSGVLQLLSVTDSSTIHVDRNTF